MRIGVPRFAPCLAGLVLAAAAFFSCSLDQPPTVRLVHSDPLASPASIPEATSPEGTEFRYGTGGLEALRTPEATFAGRGDPPSFDDFAQPMDPDGTPWTVTGAWESRVQVAVVPGAMPGWGYAEFYFDVRRGSSGRLAGATRISLLDSGDYYTPAGSPRYYLGLEQFVSDATWLASPAGWKGLDWVYLPGAPAQQLRVVRLSHEVRVFFNNVLVLTQSLDAPPGPTGFGLGVRLLDPDSSSTYLSPATAHFHHLGIYQ